jgi:hypothetical protein
MIGQQGDMKYGEVLKSHSLTELDRWTGMIEPKTYVVQTWQQAPKQHRTSEHFWPATRVN